MVLVNTSMPNSSETGQCWRSDLFYFIEFIKNVYGQ